MSTSGERSWPPSPRPGPRRGPLRRAPRASAAGSRAPVPDLGADLLDEHLGRAQLAPEPPFRTWVRISSTSPSGERSWPPSPAVPDLGADLLDEHLGDGGVVDRE